MMISANMMNTCHTLLTRPVMWSGQLQSTWLVTQPLPFNPGRGMLQVLPDAT
jgi:hypothetical protein